MIIVVSAMIRGSYHLYQGFGGFVGNLIMGADLRADLPALEAGAPLVVAHTLLDIAAFVGYALVAPRRRLALVQPPVASIFFGTSRDQLLVTRLRAKKPRLAGRSASRRTR